MELKSKKIKDFKIFYRNGEELNRIINDIFDGQDYKFKAKNDQPKIIDCGSHIGVSILYFKYLYPKAHILGFEPNPDNFIILKKNIEENHLKDVRLVNAALSGRSGRAVLQASQKKVAPWTWGDTIIYNMWGDEDDVRKISVKTVKLSDYIKGKVDFLKIDIEGAEQIVLTEIKNKLKDVNGLVMEFHGSATVKEANKLDVVKKILSEAGFKIKTFEVDVKKAFQNSIYRKNWVGLIRAAR